MQIYQANQTLVISRMFQNMSQQLYTQRQRSSNVQQQINMLTREHKRCIVGTVEANFEVMSKLMQELKKNYDSDKESEKVQNDAET